MLQISCLYCGKSLTAKEQWVGKRVKCPFCRHIFRISKQIIPQPNGKSHDAAVRHSEKFWDGKSDAEIAAMLLQGRSEQIASDEQPTLPGGTLLPHNFRHRDCMSSETVAERFLYPESAEAELTRPFFVPRYDDLALFTLGAALILLVVMSALLRDDIKRLIALAHNDLKLYIYPIVFLLGLLLSLTSVFVKRQKSDTEKAIMLIFAIVVTAGTGLYAGIKMLAGSTGLLMVFPMWNLANAAILMLYWRLGYITINCITDDTASRWQIAVSAIAITILLILCNYVFKLHWVYTYSIAVCYTMSINGVLHDYFPGPTGAKGL